MRYFCLACDYDGTIAHNGRVAPATVNALKQVRASGRKLVLVTGRLLADLARVFPELAIFDRVIAENGGLLYRPAAQETRPLTNGPQRAFVSELRKRGVAPLAVGDAIVSTWRPQEGQVLEAIQSMGLDLQITFNKDAVMVLPSGVNKGSGLRTALEELRLSAHNAVGVGDAENDHAFLDLCECSVAVSNALPAVKSRSDFVAAAPDGRGVEQLIEKLLAGDLAGLEGRLVRHRVLLGATDAKREFCLSPYGSRLVVAGPSGSGKSTFVALLVEKLVEKQYQVCVIDPEGDHLGIETLVTLGSADHRPEASEIVGVLEEHLGSLTVSLVGVPISERPAFFQKVLSSIQALRSKTGRPHWVIVDEAHQLLPESLDSANLVIPRELASLALVTVNPHHVARAILTSVNGIVLVGTDPKSVLQQFNQGAALSLESELPEPAGSGDGAVLVWLFGEGAAPQSVKLERSNVQRRRHRQKYAAGELGEDKSFYFRGPQKKLNLRAQNMNLFAQIADGLDDETWLHHLQAHDYSRWLRESIKDEVLANEAEAIEDDPSLSPRLSKARLLEAIRRHYTAPA